MPRRHLLAPLLLAAACSNPAQPAASSAPSSPPSPVAASPSPIADARSPADFGEAWAEVALLKDETEKRTRALSLITAWEGHQYEWDGFVMFNLCDEALRRCAANVIDRAKITSPELLGGFFPRLFFTEDGFTKLRQECKGKTSCVVRFRGVLSELRTDPESPLGMDFREVTALQGRDPLPSEAWWREGPSFEIPKDYKPTPAPLANAKEPPLPPLKVKVLEKTF